MLRVNFGRIPPIAVLVNLASLSSVMCSSVNRTCCSQFVACMSFKKIWLIDMVLEEPENAYKVLKIMGSSAI